MSPRWGSGQGSPACLLLSGQVSGSLGPGVSCPLFVEEEEEEKFLFCEQSLVLLPGFPRVSPQPYLPLAFPFSFHTQDAQTPSCSDMLPLLLLLPLLWAGSLAQNPRYWLDVQPSMSVQEGLCVHLPCSVTYPREGWNDSGPAHGYWFQKRVDSHGVLAVATNNPEHAVVSEAQGRFLLVGDPRAYNCSLDIRDAQRRDTGTYIFRLERGPTVRYSYALNLLSVRVMVLILTPRPQDHGTNLMCRVTFPGAGVSTEVTIRLNVSYAPQNLDIRVFWENSTGVRSLGSMEVRWGDAVKTEQNQAPDHSPLLAPMSPLPCPPLCPLAGLSLGPLWTPR
ncbi:sialic acid-binding Ig-like lectin 12 isoform X2 [Cervus canadensis]|uniref:sialic acid-binding Ig-like lectin 12 isoform X2 n=1 Tax=Cervus canadensis TaxID=1574408 RepID=UPI001CA369E0|nr:sialic acid-binding Ig-like lectin 12 isoform X2 [Cervus canadensis]